MSERKLRSNVYKVYNANTDTYWENEQGRNFWYFEKACRRAFNGQQKHKLKSEQGLVIHEFGLYGSNVEGWTEEFIREIK